MDVNAFDGYRVAAHDVPIAASSEILIWLRLAGEEILAPRTAGWFSRDPAGQSQQQRMLFLLQAVCRYLNSGGSYHQLLETLTSLREDLSRYQLSLPETWQLTRLGAEELADAPFETMFHNEEEGRYLVVVEDTYAEFIQDYEMADELTRHDAAETDPLQSDPGDDYQAPPGAAPDPPGLPGDGADGG